MNCIIDTNIIAYAYDKSELKKREKCLKLIRPIFAGEEEVYITNQILSELFYTLTKNFRIPLAVEKAELIISAIIKSDNWNKINYNHNTVKKAIDLLKSFKIPFWDSLIVATMLENNIFCIYTENTQDFKKVPRLKVINPLAN